MSDGSLDGLLDKRRFVDMRKVLIDSPRSGGALSLCGQHRAVADLIERAWDGFIHR